MKKLTITIALTTLLSLSVFAHPVDVKTAQKVATTFLNNNGAKSTQLTDLTKAAGFTNLYIFTAEDGFVVMAADDCVKPILGYSMSGSFNPEDLPENLRYWLQGYNNEIQFAIDNQLRSNTETTKLWNDLANGKPNVARATTVVESLVQTKWNQNKHYNNLCPAVSDGPEGRAYTGCVATAMAQIMKFHGYPEMGIGMHSYVWGSQTLSADFRATTYDWVNMESYYNYYYPTGTASSPNWLTDPTPAQLSAVTTLMYHCGISVDMSYGGKSTGGSGAYSIDVVHALKTYFNYSPDIEYKQKNSFDNDVWISMVKAELDANRPLFYSGSGSGGHAFVCDGYNDDNYFHFNWGWSGHYDGYFSLSNLNTGANNESGSGNGYYTNDQAAIFGIQPATLGTAAAPVLEAELKQEPGVRDVLLTWNNVEGASSYMLFCNSDLIYSGAETSYRYVHVPYGTNTYFVRSVDSNGNLSLPSNYTPITVTFAAPINLTATHTDSGIELSWSGSENAVAYNMYCNGVIIDRNIDATTYTDIRSIAGELDYQVKGIDSFGDESDISEAASISVPFSTPIVNDLELTLENGNPVLSWTTPTWCYPEAPSVTLNYGQGEIQYSWGTTYYAHRYMAADLAQYAGMVVYKVSTYVKGPGTYTLHVYTNTANNQPDALAETRTLISAGEGWKDIPLSNPVVITGETDLWIVMKQEDTHGSFPVASFNLSAYNANACYLGSSLTSLSPASTNYTISWFIDTHLTDGVYTYSLYQDGTMIDDNLSELSYTEATLNDNAPNLFTVKTNYCGGKTAASNKVGFTKGTASLASLEMAANDQMTLTENSTLTVTGTLSNDNAENLIIENGAQLIHNSTGVKATVKKVIDPTNGYDQGWNFIASPVVESIEPSQNNGLLSGIYDLYLYEEPTHMWRNHKEHIVSGINQNTASGFLLNYKQGYLYANNTSDTLQFSGTLTPSNSTDSINNLSYSASTLTGFNLVGNPYAHNVTSYTGNNVATDCYRMNENRSNIIISTINEDKPLLPAEGFFVKATADNASIIFNSNSRSETTQSASIHLDLISDNLTFDRLIVKREGEPLEKLSLRESGTKIFAMKGNQEIAVAIAEGNEQAFSFKAEENGIFTLRAKVEPKEWKYLHLIDNMTGADIDLLATPEYSFEARTDDYVSRFKLVFFAPEDVYDDAPFAYISNGEIRILGKNQDFKSLQIMDMTGRIVINRDVASNVSTTGLSAGVYVLRLINGNQVKTQKVLVP